MHTGAARACQATPHPMCCRRRRLPPGGLGALLGAPRYAVEGGLAIADFTIANVPARVQKLGDLWKPLLVAKGRFKLEKML